MLFGNNEVNVLKGEDGDDVIHGFAGDDFLSGGLGTSDTVVFAAAPGGKIGAGLFHERVVKLETACVPEFFQKGAQTVMITIQEQP